MAPSHLPKYTVDQDVFSLAIERLHYIFDQFDTVAVSFSGGKDSTAVLNLAEQVAIERGRTPLRVFHFDEEAIPYECEDYVRRVAAREHVHLDWYCLPVKHRNAGSRKHPYWYTWAPEDEHLWVRPMPPEALTEVNGYDGQQKESRSTIPAINGLLYPPDQYGRVCVLLGIRADESLTRQRAVTNREHENYIVQHAGGYSGAGKMLGWKNVWKAYPIYDWRTEDIWTAIARYDWDYCTAYDLWEMAGISHDDQRLAPPYGEEPGRSLWKYKVCHPELWDRMVNRVPGAATLARYSKTALWGYGGVNKADDESWEQAIRRAIAKFNPGSQRQIAHRIQDEIKRHNQATHNAPILARTPHPHTGLTWQFLLQIATRGDFKGRKVANSRVFGRDPQKLWLAYNAGVRALSEERSNP